ncbi:hypothetical protein [Acinetobacter vivianii]|uniref:hypothetical protein n=1 Tax=Acinetobacter vivianii TaxID=1776742 RepID=UPI004042B36E
MTVTVRLQTRLPSEIHARLGSYAEQEGISLNTAMINLLDFSLSYAKKGEHKLLDNILSDLDSNLRKVKFIVNDYIINDATDEYAKENKDFYLDYISERFTELPVEEQRLVSDLVHTLTNKD